MRKRLKEDWMQKGVTVKLPNNTGILKSFTESRIGDGTYILSVSVQPTGVNQPFPFNPFDIDPVPQRIS